MRLHEIQARHGGQWRSRIAAPGGQDDLFEPPPLRAECLLEKLLEGG